MVKRESSWIVSRMSSCRFLSHERKEAAVEKKNSQPPWAMLSFVVNVVRLVVFLIKHPPLL